MFSENLKVVREEFSSAMDMTAGKNLKVSTIFDRIEELEQGKFKTLNEMYDASGFNGQNKVYQAVSAMLTNLGTPISSLTKGNKKPKLEGTAFALDILKKNGITLPEKKAKEVEYEDTVSL